MSTTPERQASRLSRDSDELLADLTEVRELEEQKRQEPISTERFHELAEDITGKSHEIFRKAYREEEDGNETETSEQSIADVDADAR